MVQRTFKLILAIGFSLSGCSPSHNISRLSGGENNPLAPEKIIPPKELVASVSFADVYSQVFRPRCIACHGTSGRVSLETYQSAKAILKQIGSSTLETRRMPKAPEPPLNSSELLILAAWIEAEGPETPLNGSEPVPIPEPGPLEPRYNSIKAKIIDVKCLRCHSPSGEAHRIPFVTREDLLNSPLDIVIPGNAEESGLTLVLREGARKRMPPPTSGFDPVSIIEIDIVEEWINQGAAEN